MEHTFLPTELSANCDNALQFDVGPDNKDTESISDSEYSE